MSAATDLLRIFFYSLHKQVSVMSINLSQKLDELQRRGDRQLETTVALCEIRTQLQELTKSVESCQSEVSEVKRDMVAIKVCWRKKFPLDLKTF